MNENEVVQGDECSCDVCAEFRAEWHDLSGGQKLERVIADRASHDASYWKGYAEELEAQNYDLERENVELREELSAERARCSECGRHK